MPDLTVPVVLLALVLLILLGQWIMVRHAQTMRGKTAPDALMQSLDPADRAAGEGGFFFESPGCGACHKMSPIVESVFQDASIPLCKLNIQTDPSLARSLRIMGTPTLIIVHEGMIIEVIVGIVSESKLRSLIARHGS